MESIREDSPGGAHLLSAGAAAALFAGLVPGWLGWDPAALALVSLAALLACLAAFSRRAAAWAGRLSPRHAERIAWALALAACGWHVVVPPGMYLEPVSPWAFRGLAAGAAAVAASAFAPRLDALLARWRVPLLVLLYALMAAVVLRASPAPFMDVFYFQQWGAEALTMGANPYALDFPNIYENAAPYGDGVLVDGRIVSYPYPPLTLLLGTPAFALGGDVRWHLLLLTAAAALLAWRLSPGRFAGAAIALFLFQPRSFFVLEQAWTEPVVLAGFAATVLAARRWITTGRGWILAATAAGLLLAGKQYAPLVALPLAAALPARRRTAALALALGVAAAIYVPFAVWDAGELWRDVAVMQFRQPFRKDALSWLIPVSMLRGDAPVSPAAAFALAFGACGAGVWLGRASLAAAARASAAALLLLVLFNKQAFANYYWLCGGLCVIAAALELAEREAAALTSAPRPAAR